MSKQPKKETLSYKATPRPKFNNPGYKEIDQGFRELGRYLANNLENGTHNYKKNSKTKSSNVKILTYQEFVDNPDLLKNKKKFGTFYREKSPGNDELIPTSAVREIIKGVLDSKGKIKGKSLNEAFELINQISEVRFPTNYTGNHRLGNSMGMQHPTANDTGIWEPGIGGGKVHSELDKKRKLSILSTAKQGMSKKESVQTLINNVIKESIRFTLNVFTAPATARDQKSRASPERKEMQTLTRENLKKLGVKCGLGQDGGDDESKNRAWGNRDNKSTISDNRVNTMSDNSDETNSNKSSKKKRKRSLSH